MKNLSKLFGIIAFVAVIGFSMISCDLDKDEGDLNGVWVRDGGDIVITINGSNGIFIEINTGMWKTVQTNGLVSIGDKKFRNIKRTGSFRWSGEELHYAQSENITGWFECTIGMGTSGKIYISSTVTDDISNYTKN